MKTEKEFIQGIYEKADKIGLEKQNNIKSISNQLVGWNWKKTMPIAVACLLALIILPIGFSKDLWLTKDKEDNLLIDKSENQQEFLEQGSEEGVQEPVAAKLFIEEEDRNNIEVNQIFYLVSGMITKIEKAKTAEENSSNINASEQVDMKVRIVKAYQGNLSGDITITCEKNALWFDTEVEEQELLFYLSQEGESYTLSNGDYSIYKYKQEENKEKIYEAMDGSLLSSEIIDQNME